MPQNNKNSTSKLGQLFRYPTLLVFIVSFAVFAGANVYVTFKAESAAKAAGPPQPALADWLTQLGTYYGRKASYPPTLIELEREVWMPQRKGEDAKTTKLEYGPRMFLFDNYAYLYTRDAGDANVCSLWAVPQGEHYKEGNTFYLLITPKSVTAWRGGALTVDQMRSIPKAARPTGEEMARLGMYKQNAVPETKARKKLPFPFSLFE